MNLKKGLEWLVVGVASLYLTNSCWTYKSREFQLPRPRIVQASEWGRYAKEKKTIIMNTEPLIEVDQTSSGLEVRVRDRDGFYADDTSSNPTLYIYEVSEQKVTPLIRRKKFLLKPTKKVIFSEIKLSKGKYVLAIHYHEESGLFNEQYQEIEIK